MHMFSVNSVILGNIFVDIIQFLLDLFSLDERCIR